MPEDRNTPEKDQPKYEAPALFDLGILARGQGGGTCSVGTNPTGAPCTPGGSAVGLCTIGGGV
jgi:hypothetical protein